MLQVRRTSAPGHSMEIMADAESGKREYLVSVIGASMFCAELFVSAATILLVIISLAVCSDVPDPNGPFPIKTVDIILTAVLVFLYGRTLISRLMGIRVLGIDGETAWLSVDGQKSPMIVMHTAKREVRLPIRRYSFTGSLDAASIIQIDLRKKAVTFLTDFSNCMRSETLLK